MIMAFTQAVKWGLHFCKNLLASSNLRMHKICLFSRKMFPRLFGSLGICDEELHFFFFFFFVVNSLHMGQGLIKGAFRV